MCEKVAWRCVIMSHAWLKQYPDKVGPSIEIPEEMCIASLLESTCKKFAAKKALTCMGTSLTFRQYDSLANDFAAYLQTDAKLAKGDRIAVMLPNIIQFPIALFAANKIGAVCVNTNPLYTPREMKHQFADSGAKVIIILDMFVDKLQEIIKDTAIETVIVTSIGDQHAGVKGLIIDTVLKLKGQIPKHTLPFTSFKSALRTGSSKSFTKPRMKLDDIAVLQYTGGTTGLSKGAMLTHRNIIGNVKQIQAWASPYVSEGEEVILTALPLYHIFALTVNFLSFFTLGGEMILVPKPVPIINTVKIFKKYRITVMTGINTLYNALNNNPEFQANPPRSLKFALAGGMALQSSVGEAFEKLTGTRVVEGYGLTESSPVTHCNPLHIAVPLGSIGVPLPSTLAEIRDEEGKPLPTGEVGELAVKGPQIMLGYWQKDDETKATIRDGWLFTGDMAKMDDKGFFYIVDRKKDMVLVSGFNVYPNEVENVIMGNPKVLEVAVIGVLDQHSGEAVKAFVVKKDQSLTEEELKRFQLGKNLSESKPELPRSLDSVCPACGDTMSLDQSPEVYLSFLKNSYKHGSQAS
ncbi:MAG: long-chain-fatty-acid--CoA ligase [Proteobacteria bacterium]|nr:MAG: long-chain-fatty-acid--CoA ligase [Pseudomonadota bacterium]